MTHRANKIRRVFLSSTARDLGKHREAVYHGINQLSDWKCNRMEEWGAEPGPREEQIERQIANSDLFVGLVGALYGTLVPSKKERISYTQYEYDVASKLGKPQLMYIVPDDGIILSWSHHECDEIHSLQDSFRKMVREEESSAIVKTPEEFATRVLLDIRNWETSPLKKPNPAAFQVPLPPTTLFGRDKIIQQALASLREHRNVLLHGMSGAGKSAIAYQIARGLRGRQVYIDLKASLEHAQKAPLLIVKENIIRALRPGAMLSGEDEIESIYNNLVDKTVLIVLDSVGLEDIKGLRSPARARFRFILTSWYNIAFHDLDHFDVEPVSPADACRILEALSDPARPTKSQLAKIGELCGHLPLGLRSAAGYLRSHVTEPVDNYIRMFEDSPLERTLGDDVTRVLTVPVKALERSEPGLSQKWRMLSVFPGDFDEQAAKAVWPASEHGALGVLTELMDRSLVMYDVRSCRYRLHDLMRTIAQTELSRRDDEYRSEQAYARHAKYFLSVLQTANADLGRGVAAVTAGLQLYDRESNNIRAGHSWAERNRGANQLATSLCKEYMIAGADVLALRLLPQERLRWIEAALEVCQMEKDSHGEAFLLDERGVVFRESADAARAINEHRSALERITGEQDATLRTRALINLGRAHWELGDPGQAITYYTDALGILNNIERPGRGENILREGALDGLGIAYREAGRATEAIECHRNAVSLADQLNSVRDKARALDNLGLDLQRQGEYGKALWHYQEALRIAAGIGDSMEKAAILDHLSELHRLSGELDEAERCSSEALDVAKTIGDRRMEARATGNMALLLEEKGELCRARDLHIRHREISSATKDLWGEVAALDHLGALCRDLRDLDDAGRYLEEALEKVEMLGNNSMKGAVCGDLGLLWMAMGDMRKAVNFHEEHLALAKEASDRRGVGAALNHLADAYEKTGEHEKAIACLREAAEAKPDDKPFLGN